MSKLEISGLSSGGDILATTQNSPHDLSLLSKPSTDASKDPKKLAEAAKQFEALMITQMMKSVRESSGGGWLNDGDQTGEDSAMGMAEEQFAQAMASSGGLGLAKMVVQTMSRERGLTQQAAQNDD